MKRLLSLLMAMLFLGGCSAAPAPAESSAETTQEVNTMRSDLTLNFVSAPGQSLPAKQTYQFRSGDVPELGSGDTVLLELEVCAVSRCEKLEIIVYQGGSQTGETYFVPTQWTRIALCTDSQLSLAGLMLATDGDILLRSLTAENCGKTTPDGLLPRLGQFVVDEYKNIELPETGTGTGRTTDLVQKGDLVYSIGSGSFAVTDVSDPDAPRVLGRLSGLGDTRQIALCESGTDVMVTARGYGAYIIDASDPSAPRLRACYDSVEMATGICIEGSYAYISNRQYGVEVVDLSDLDVPLYVRTIPTGEVQSARVVDGILYCGLYGQHRVDMYDLTTEEPTLLGSAPLNGRGDGLYVVKDETRTLLYAATGHHTAELSSETPLTDARYGQGNGLDILDVTDPANPIWLSTSRTNGRFYSPSYDYWEASVFTSGERRYACLVSSFNGVYLLDVTDPAAPIRTAHITVPVPQSSQNYIFYKNDIRTLAFPFDRYKGIWSPIGGAACGDGALYMGGILTDLHVVQLEQIAPAMENPQQQLTISGTETSLSYPLFDTAGQVHAVTANDGVLWAACGSDGIAVLDTSLRLKTLHATAGICYDVLYRDGVLYAAEGTGGLAAYDAATLEPLWRWSEDGRSVKQVRLSPNARFAVLHMADNEGCVLRIEDLTVVYSKKGSSQMYHHNVCNQLVAGRYLCFWAHSTGEIWLDFGPEDDRVEPSVIREYKPRSHMTGGVTGFGDLALCTTSQGILLYDPAAEESLEELEPVSIGGCGKPTVSGSRLVTTNRLSGQVLFVDISDPSLPREQWTVVLPGNPEIALIHGGAVYIPLANAGLVKLPMP